MGFSPPYGVSAALIGFSPPYGVSAHQWGFCPPYGVSAPPMGFSPPTWCQCPSMGFPPPHMGSVPHQWGFCPPYGVSAHQWGFCPPYLHTQALVEALLPPPQLQPPLPRLGSRTQRPPTQTALRVHGQQENDGELQAACGVTGVMGSGMGSWGRGWGHGVRYRVMGSWGLRGRAMGPGSGL